MAKKARSIKITLTFEEDDLNTILNCATFGNDDAPRVEDLTAAQFKDFKEELQSTADDFVEEIVEGSHEACANDWLYDFMRTINPE